MGRGSERTEARETLDRGRKGEREKERGGERGREGERERERERQGRSQQGKLFRNAMSCAFRCDAV